MFKLDLENQRNHRLSCQHSLDHRKSKRVPEKTSTSASLTVLKCVDHNKLGKILKKMEIPKPPDLPPEKPVYRSRNNR